MDVRVFLETATKRIPSKRWGETKDWTWSGPPGQEGPRENAGAYELSEHLIESHENEALSK